MDTDPDVDHDPGAVAGRRERFELLFALVYEPLQRYVRRRAESTLVDDVVADTLLVLWRRLDDVPVANELSWSYGVARRCLANQRRSAARPLQLVQRLETDPTAQISSHSTETAAEVQVDLLRAALAELDDDDRELLRLWAWEQLEPREIAVVLAVTPNAVSIRLHRVKQRMRQSTQQPDVGKNLDPGGHKPLEATKEER